MRLKNDLDNILKNWGPIKAEVDEESIELWGKINPKFIIKTYQFLSARSGIVNSYIIETSGQEGSC